jgi:hypothetical protein
VAELVAAMARAEDAKEKAGEVGARAVQEAGTTTMMMRAMAAPTSTRRQPSHASSRRV